MYLTEMLVTYSAFIILYIVFILVTTNGILNGLIRRKFRPNPWVRKYETGSRAVLFGLLNVVIGVFFLLLLTYHLLRMRPPG